MRRRRRGTAVCVIALIVLSLAAIGCPEAPVPVGECGAWCDAAPDTAPDTAPDAAIDTDDTAADGAAGG